MKLKAYSILCLALILAFAWTMPAFAAGWDLDAASKLTLQYQFSGEEPGEPQPISGASFRVYRVGDTSNNGTYRLTLDGYEKQSLSEMTTESWTAEAKAMSDYVRGKRTIQPLETQKTDETGTLTFSAVTSTGLYLVVGDPLTKDGWTYTPNPFLVMLPSYGSDGGWDYNITSVVKGNRTPYNPGPGPRPSPSPSPSPEPSTEPSEDPAVSPEPSEDPTVSPEPSTEPSEGPEVSPEPSPEVSQNPDVPPVIDLRIVHTGHYLGPNHRPANTFRYKLYRVATENSLESEKLFDGENRNMKDRTVDGTEAGTLIFSYEIKLSKDKDQETTVLPIGPSAGGTDHYILYEELDGAPGVTYDDTVFDIYVEGSNWWAIDRNTGLRVEALEHWNYWNESNPTPSPTVTVKPTPTPAAQLPKTGTRMWLVPYLVAIGCVLIVAGIALGRRKRHG